jgi:hypothetical protein
MQEQADKNISKEDREAELNKSVVSLIEEFQGKNKEIVETRNKVEELEA